MKKRIYTDIEVTDMMNGAWITARAEFVREVIEKVEKLYVELNSSDQYYKEASGVLMALNLFSPTDEA